jgi:hypothetical protein
MKAYTEHPAISATMRHMITAEFDSRPFDGTPDALRRTKSPRVAGFCKGAFGRYSRYSVGESK